MPFTAAHPSIFIPVFRNRLVSVTALVTGSIAPDFEYFFKLDTGSEHSHTVAGIFYFDLPVAIVLSLVFHLMIRKPLTANLPDSVRKKFSFDPEFNFILYLKRKYLVFILCALAGIGSHVLWDRFTHNGWFAQNLEIYKMISLRIGDLDYPLFFILQQLSTAAGCFALLVYFIASPPIFAGKTLYRPLWWYWPSILLITCLISFLHLGIPDIETQHGQIVVTVVAGFLAGLTVVSAIAGLMTRTKS